MPDSVQTVKSKINTLLFDAAGTLLFLTEAVGKSYSTVAKAHGLILDSVTVTQAFQKVWRSLPPRNTTNGPRPDDDRAWWRTLAEEVLIESGAKLEEFNTDAWFEELYTYFAQPGRWQAFPDVIPVLEKLRPQYRMAVVSNFDRRLYQVLENTKLSGYFDAVFLSSELGVDKPDPKIFHLAMEKMNSNPDQTLHVGDDALRDQQGARNAGLDVFLLDRPAITLTHLLPLLCEG
ncbi:MAG: HAD-IA family hydrolase [Chthoniobacterales bacterium]